MINEETSEFLRKNPEYKFESIPEKTKYVKKKPLLDRIGFKILAILSWIETKLFALASVALAVFLIYYSNFFKVLYEHDKIDNFFFALSILCYVSAISIFIFLCVYLPYFKNIHENRWDELYPNLIPAATIFGLIGMISLITSIWEVWGWYSIILVTFIKWGFVMTAHFAPGGFLGTFTFWAIIILALISGYYIEHEGHLH